MGDIVDYDYLKHATNMSSLYTPKTDQGRAFAASIAALLKSKPDFDEITMNSISDAFTQK